MRKHSFRRSYPTYKKCHVMSHRNTDDGYDAARDDRDGHVTENARLYRLAEETARANAELDRCRKEKESEGK